MRNGHSGPRQARKPESEPGLRRRVGATSATLTQLGLGSAALGNLYAPVDDETAAATVEAALRAGVRYFDTAPYYGYGLAERRVGAALVAAGNGEVVVSTKVGRLLSPRAGPAREDQGYVAGLPFDPVFDYSYDGVMRSVTASLERMQRSAVDILLLHDVGALTHGEAAHPEIFETAMVGGYLALDELRRAGHVRAIGLGVNETAVCMEAAERADFDCFLLAGRYTLLDQSALRDLLPLCARRGISLIIGGPYNSGALVEGPEARVHYDYADAAPEIIERVAAIRGVCDAHCVPLPAAALQFPLLHPAVASVIPGARSPREVEKNAAWLGHPIPPALWDDLKAAELLDPEAPCVPAPGAG